MFPESVATTIPSLEKNNKNVTDKAEAKNFSETTTLNSLLSDESCEVRWYYYHLRVHILLVISLLVSTICSEDLRSPTGLHSMGTTFELKHN